MPSNMDLLAWPLLVTLAALVDMSIQAPLSSNLQVATRAQSKIPASIESELQALVDKGMLQSPEKPMNRNPDELHLGQDKSIAPEDLARAATLVDAQLMTEAEAMKPQKEESGPATASAVTKAQAAGPVEDPMASLDLTPRAVAEYLLITGDFGGFESALRDLLNAQVISPVEVMQYKDAVGWEYEALLYKLVNVKAASLQEFMSSDSLSTKSNFISPVRPQPAITKPGKAAAMLPPHKVAPPGVNMHAKLRKLQMRALMEKEATIDELINMINRNDPSKKKFGGETDVGLPGNSVPLQKKAVPYGKKSEDMVEKAEDVKEDDTKKN